MVFLKSRVCIDGELSACDSLSFRFCPFQAWAWNGVWRRRPLCPAPCVGHRLSASHCSCLTWWTFTTKWAVLTVARCSTRANLCPTTMTRNTARGRNWSVPSVGKLSLGSGAKRNTWKQSIMLLLPHSSHWKYILDFPTYVLAFTIN